ncbi:MAG: phosphate ABC transporter permease [Candidatus Altiarchaeales archaeon A3]|nr:MAG: phosphate ABC transporter permease [Candidatus Altiarchaeales archaeon A3]
MIRKISLSSVNKKSIEEFIVRAILFICAIIAIIAVFSILFFLLKEGYGIFQQVSLWDFLSGTDWKPEGELYGTTPYYGALPLIVGTLFVTLGAMVIAVPLSIGSAIFISEIAPPKVNAFIKPAVELLAGIPSVVFGFLGLIVLTTWLRITFDVPTGESMLAGSILLGVMALPTITSIAEDAISSVPREYKEGSLALGATKWQTISRVVVPSAMSGITAAVVLGLGKVIGETMAVIMVTGNTAIIPGSVFDVFSTVKTLTGAIAIEMGETPIGSNWMNALFGLGIILMAITLFINIIANFVLGKLKEKTTSAGVKKKRAIISIPKENIEKIKKYVHILFALIVFCFLVYFINIPAAVFIFFAAFCFYIGNKRISPKNAQRVAFGLIISSMIVVLFVLGFILYYIVSNGIGALTLEFLTEPPKDLGRAGGIFPAIAGTFYLIIGAIIIALPVGVCAAIYLTEYKKEGRLTSVIRSAVELLNGTPSIVFGLFGFAFLVLFLNLGISLIAGQIVLALMVLPTIIRTTEEALKTVPQSIREGSLALGATKWQTIKQVVMPPSIPGIVTGAILSIGRVSGETAPIMFTAVVFSQRFIPDSVMEPVMALPYHLFILATSIPGSGKNAAGTALVLLVLVVAFYLVAILIRNYYKKRTRW